MDFENTALWSHAMGVRVDDAYHRQRDRLRTAYFTAWQHGCELSAQINKDLPQLTLHDERHFNALWRRADQIVGGSEPLNPAELFVFGCAILLHDAANSAAAFAGGLPEIEQSAEWHDELVERLHITKGAPLTEEDISGAPEEMKKTVLLHTLRRIHAKRAEMLADISFRNEAGVVGQVISDDGLRMHLGRLIGLIAASHHWNIQDLPRRLPKIVGALAEFPATWTIRPIRIACLLRCADAIQVDQSRAPDFLYAMLDLRGVSESHWRAQNRLLAPVNDPDDDTALIFSSSRDFYPEDVEAWWIAFEALRTANRELQDSLTLLKDIKQPIFQVNRIRDAESPDRLARHVRVAGWRPVSAEVKVSNVGNVVRLFGGSQLYGDDLIVPIRELIQNSADAVRRRREMPHENNYQGEVTIRTSSNSDGFLIEIDDDGIGMSEATLTGPLIEFGSSYFGSSLAKDERPGMTARSGKRLGKYGVGFFSAFMIADSVTVTSRPFDSSVSDAKTLRFANGFSLHPVLLEADLGSVNSLISTTISLRVSASNMKKLTYIRVDYGQNAHISVDFQELIKTISAMLDVDVYVQEDGGDRQLVHNRRWFDGDWGQWASDIALQQYRGPETSNEIDKLIPFLEPICADEPSLGIATINPYFHRFGLNTVSGLISSKHADSPVYDEYIFGCIDYLPAGPKRDFGHLPDEERVANWATRQAQKLATLPLRPFETLTLSERVSGFGGDPWAIAQFSLNRSLIGMQQLLEKILKGDEFKFVVEHNRYYSPDNDQRDCGRIKLRREDDYFKLNSSEIEFSGNIVEAPLDLYGATESLYLVIGNDTEMKESLFTMLVRRIEEKGFSVSIDKSSSEVVGKYIGPISQRDNLNPGMELKSSVVSMRIVQA